MAAPIALTRRQATTGLLSAGAGIVASSPARAFFPALFATALRGIGASALRAGATRATASSIGRLTVQRSTQSATALRTMRPGLSRARTSDAFMQTFGREIVAGAGNEVGKTAARAAIQYLRGGFGAVQAEAPPYAGYPEEDVCYGAFPNEGPDDQPLILGCLEIYALNSLPALISRDFLSLGYQDPAIVHLLSFHPTRLEQLVHHDGDWVATTPAVFRTPGCIIEMRSIKPRSDRRYIETTVRLGGSATRLYSARVPIDPQFR